MKITDELLIQWRIDSAKQAITRARNVLLIAVLVSVTLFIAEFNGYFSWYRYFVLVPKVNDMTRSADDFPKDIRENYLKIAQEQLVKSWVESRMVTVSPLGIRFGIGDIAVIGTPALFILALVFWYCARRENHTIVHLLRDTQDAETISESEEDARKIMAAIFHAISSHLVFVPVNEMARPLEGLEDKGPLPQSRLIRVGFRFLLYLPLAAAVFISGIEVYTNEFESHLSLRVFRDNLANQKTLDQKYRKDTDLQSLIEHVDFAEKVQRVIYDVAPAVFTVCLLLVLRRVERYQTATIDTLKSYAYHAKIALLTVGPPPPSSKAAGSGSTRPSGQTS